MAEIPTTVVECDGCGEDLNVLEPFLSVAVKPKVRVLVVEEGEAIDPDDIAPQNIYLGNKNGRGPKKGFLTFHDFKCAGTWFAEREDLQPKLEAHVEDEIYVPEDNRSPEELVDAGELPEEFLALQESRNGGEE